MKMVYGIIEPSALAKLRITGNSSKELYDALEAYVSEKLKAGAAAGKTPVSWNFTTMPSEEWKNGVGSALTAYAAGTGDWNGVVSAFVDGWASEAALNAA